MLPHDFKPGDRAVPLGHKISEGVAISRRVDDDRLVEHARAVSRTCSGEGESVIYTANIVHDRMGSPALVQHDRRSIRAKAPECTLEAQDFRRNDTELIYTCYRGQYADVFGIELASGPRDHVSQDGRRVQRGGGDLS